MNHSGPVSVGNAPEKTPINDQNATWRIVYRDDPDAIMILDVFKKTTAKTPLAVIDTCKRRLMMYDDD